MGIITTSNPEGLHAPQAAFSHAALIQGASRRLVVSGQPGVTPDGRIAAHADEQIDQIFRNLDIVLKAHDMTPANVVRLTAYLVQRIHIGPWRRRRDRWLNGHQPAATLVLVDGFADPRFVAEVELEAVA
ncbi:RidA family protein [Roseomonas gilardii subsp. gilardii]|uniref:RidA family protein n=1 Tax=Roseomonas gilardii TaxID=257708 RepID=UPI001FF8D7B0|nr:RidA family protein [Roseomonas gilardii]UPG70866.1 RidA family protein [Roseomonas gilardii subsp. gilardii]